MMLCFHGNVSCKIGLHIKLERLVSVFFFFTENHANIHNDDAIFYTIKTDHFNFWIRFHCNCLPVTLLF